MSRFQLMRIEGISCLLNNYSSTTGFKNIVSNLLSPLSGHTYEEQKMFLQFGLLSTVTTGFESPKTFMIPLLVAVNVSSGTDGKRFVNKLFFPYVRQFGPFSQEVNND